MLIYRTFMYDNDNTEMNKHGKFYFFEGKMFDDNPIHMEN